MKHLIEDTFEDQITAGKVQKIEQIVFRFHQVLIYFENVWSGKRKLLTIDEVTAITMQPDEKDTTDVMAYETLIGYDCTKTGEFYFHCLKTDSYELTIRSYGEPHLIDLP